MISFYTTWCGWCRRLEKETFADTAVIALSQRLACVKVDAERHPELARAYRARAFPTVVFIDRSGKLVESARGYLPPERFRVLLERILDRSGEEFILRQRLRDHPELPAPRKDLARVLMASGRCEEAILHLDTLLSRTEDRSVEAQEIRLERARALLQAGRLKEARSELEALTKDTEDPSRRSLSVYYLGEAKFALGDRRGARKEFEKLLGMRSEGWIADRARARLGELG